MVGLLVFPPNRHGNLEKKVPKRSRADSGRSFSGPGQTFFLPALDIADIFRPFGFTCWQLSAYFPQVFWLRRANF